MASIACVSVLEKGSHLCGSSWSFLHLLFFCPVNCFFPQYGKCFLTQVTAWMLSLSLQPLQQPKVSSRLDFESHMRPLIATTDIIYNLMFCPAPIVCSQPQGFPSDLNYQSFFSFVLPYSELIGQLILYCPIVLSFIRSGCWLLFISYCLFPCFFPASDKILFE